MNKKCNLMKLIGKFKKCVLMNSEKFKKKKFLNFIYVVCKFKINNSKILLLFIYILQTKFKFNNIIFKVV